MSKLNSFERDERSQRISAAAGINYPLLALGILQVAGAGVLIATSSGIYSLLGYVLAATGAGLTIYLMRSGSGGGASSELVAVLRTINDAQGDLSRTMPELGDPTSREAARLFNQFMDRLRTALEELRRHSIKVTLTSAQSRKMAEEASRNAGRQEESSELIYRSSEETATAIEELSRWTSSIADVNSRNLQTARGSVQDLMQAASQIGSVSDMMHAFHGTVEQLETTSESIQGILGTVQGFAAQTNMLALNAAIEAARAGEQGRGFAVVADEVRDLAVKVRGAADEIGNLLENMIEVVSRTSSGTEKMIAEAEQVRTSVGTSSTQFERMVADFEAAHSDLLQVSAAAEELTVANQDVRNRSHEIRDLGLRIKDDMTNSYEQTATLLDSTDKALHKLCQFRIGRGKLEDVLEKMEMRRDRLQVEMSRLHTAGVDLFDRNHAVIPNTNPVKHDIVWAKPFQQACQHLIDEWARDQDGSLYCLPLDSKGYVAIHRSEFSHPPSGDPKVDLVKSRHMRFFQTRDIHHMGRFRLQSYLRDTGEVMFNLSVPIEVSGRFWGGLFIGLPATVLEIG